MILLKKALRSIWGNKRAYIACVTLLGIGMMIFVAMGIASARLEISKNTYYKENRMADVFARVNSIPDSARDSLSSIKGISDVSLRLKQDVRIIIPGNEKIMTMRLASADLADDDPINKISITGGGFSSENGIVVSQDFLNVHGFSIGDSVTLAIYGREKDFVISGTGESPEYVYIVKDISEMLPDPEAFSIGFIPLENMWSLLDKKGLYNDVSFILEPGYSYDDVKISLEDELKKYGLIELLPRKDQISASMLDAELTGITSMSTTIPFAFVAMAIIVLYLMLKCVIEQDRTQIGTMKAFGYSNTGVLAHYMLYGFVTGLLGGVFGCGLGYLLSGAMMTTYAEYFKMPFAGGEAASGYIAGGIIFSVVSGIVGAFMGAKSVIKLTPTEAMRPEAPKNVKSDGLRFVPFAKYILTSTGFMAVRSIFRSKLRSAFIVMGVMFAFGILAFMGSYGTIIDDMLMSQFTDIQLYDARINFEVPVSYSSAIESAQSIDGTEYAEGMLEIPVMLKHGYRKQGITITGLPKNATLYRIYDSKEYITYDPPEDGIILSNSLASELHAKRGDTLTVSSSLLNEDVEVLVSKVVNQSLGSSSYMEISTLGKLIHLPGAVTSVMLKTNDMPYLKDFLKSGKNVGVIEDKVITYENYKSFMASYTYVFYLMEVVGVVVAFAIIYNTSTIALSERKREYATLRVIGMQTREVGGIMAFEYWILSIAGIILGIPFTVFLKESIASLMDIVAFTFPTYTPPSAYLIGAIGCFIAVFASNRSAVKKIRGFDMVEVLKERE